jgi:hypothetical protein
MLLSLLFALLIYWVSLRSSSVSNYFCQYIQGKKKLLLPGDEESELYVQQ